MRYVEIEGLEQPVSVIGLGTTSSVFTPAGYDRAAELIGAFLEAGGNCIDTAHIYGFGDSERALGRWLDDSGRRAEIVLISKGCHPDVDRDDPFAKPWVSRVSPEAIHTDLSESLGRLRTDHIDLYLLHRDDETVAPGPLLDALNEEQANGRITAFGASNWTVERVAAANENAARHGRNGFVARRV
jgi:1-deoxyxylulose-5-phosphate synthase